MKKYQLKKLIKEEISKVLKENKYDIDDPESQLYQLNYNEQDVALLNNMTSKYGLGVVLMWLSSGEYGDRLTENNPVKESFRDDITGAKRMIDAGKSEEEVIKRYGIEAFNAVNAENEYM